MCVSVCVCVCGGGGGGGGGVHVCMTNTSIIIYKPVCCFGDLEEPSAPQTVG